MSEPSIDLRLNDVPFGPIAAACQRSCIGHDGLLLGLAPLEKVHEIQLLCGLPELVTKASHQELPLSFGQYTRAFAMLGPEPATALAPVETSETRARRFGQRAAAALLRSAARIEVVLDRILWGLRRRIGRLGPLQVIPYRGFGTRARAVVRGRVVEASVLERSLPVDTRLKSFRRMLRRFNSSEVPEAAVHARVGALESAGVTDDEGYFALPLTLEPDAVGDGWHSAQVQVVSVPVRGFRPVSAAVDMLVPSATAELGIISDIDDTVLQTHVTQKLKMIWVTLSGSAFTRMPFEGTSELYHALVAGASGKAENPVFYVSKSPWNLYDFLVDFMDHHRLPRGPLLLRDIGLREAPPLDHKSAAVRELMETYAHLPFVLIGDSGERDPDIYLTTAALYPGRVRAIYIRDLGGRDAEARELCQKARELGTEMLWVGHARQALEHARQAGLVSPEVRAKLPVSASR